MISPLLALLLGLIAPAPAAAPAPLPLAPPWTGTVPARETHPCLFFGAADVPRLRERLQREPYQSWWARRRESGDEAALAFRWLMTGDEAAAGRAREALLSKPIWREPRNQYIYSSSFGLFATVMAYDFLATWPGLSAEDHRQIRGKLAAEAEHYFAAMLVDKGGQHEGNQRTLGAAALGCCALVLAGYEGSEHTPRQWLERALTAIRAPGNFSFFRPDGMYVESYGYTVYMGLLFVPFMASYSRLSGQDLFTDPTLAAWLRYHAYFFLPDNRNINFGTTNYGGQSAVLYPLIANRFGKEHAPLYAWVARRTYDGRLHQILTYAAIGLFDDTLAARPEALPASAVFPVSQQMVMKDGWKDDLTGVWITGKEAGWNDDWARTYSQGDAGSFVFYSGQQFLAVDAGYPHWNGRDCYGPEFHNLVLIDGQGPTGATPGTLSDAVTDGRVDAATVTTEYAGHKSQRVFLFAEKRALLVADFLGGKGSHEYTFQLHTPVTVGKAAVTTTADTATWPGFDARNDAVSETTAAALFAGPVTLGQIPSHWRPSDNVPVENVTFGAIWRGEGATALLTALWAQQPRQSPVTMARRTEGPVQRIEARSDAWIVTAQLRATPGRLKDDAVEATTRLMVTSRELRGGRPGALRWLYVWDASALKAAGLAAKEAAGVRRGLLTWDGKRWKTAPPATGR